MRPIHDTLDWNLLRTFIVIVQEQSVSRAATRLYLSQPAVSLSLKRLEERLGQKLIERDSHRFRVTEAGHLVYREAVEIYANVARLAASVGESDPEIAGHISLAFVTGIECCFLDSVLEQFHQRHPHVTFEIEDMSSMEVQQALLQRQSLLGICLMQRTPDHLTGHTLARQQYRLYCGPHHHLFGRHNLSMDELKLEPYISFSSEQLDGVLSPLAVFRANQGLKGPVVGQSSRLQEIQRMIEASMGIGCLPEYTVMRDVKEGRLWPLPPYDGVAPIDLNVLWHSDERFNVVERTFIEFFQNALAKVPLEDRLSRGIDTAPPDLKQSAAS
ncbi:LysR family transcriptional regulator [Halomonas huangheensis]|uniref:HTH lysR-type domain-containing protein n=1 Tax=Halomonas huangheensis TaxID=1178482 RepID=W1N5M7_9GAMM|nr:LysR family transcriptional regulator [Halomonas huangheensis]ALM54316.1 LysR family transcriptional regulator [Halomonas huangheensis]ERL50872.1 hypothetical protein BJB45_19945 [Halomonas huangheensis]